MSDDLNSIKNGPVKLMDFYPALIPFIPEFVKNSWMKLQRMKDLRSDLRHFMEVSKTKGIFE